MKKSSDKKGKIIAFLYLVGVIGMFLLVVLICLNRKEPKQKGNEETYQNITTLWTLDREGTQSVDVKKLGEYMDEESGVLSMFYQLPKMNHDLSLVYRSKDVYTRLLIDKEVVYETASYESRFYNKSPGNLWNVFNISSKYSGKCLELQVIMVYDTNALTVDGIFLGDKADIIMGIFADNIFGVIVSLLLLLIGGALIIVDWLPTNISIKKHHGLCWIGLYALITGAWSLVETNVVQFCVDDMRILQLLDNMLVLLNVVPVFLYLNCTYQILKNRAMRMLGYINVVYILLSVVVQYSGVKDLHFMLNGGLYLMMISDLVMCIWLIICIFKLKKQKKPLLNCFLMILGLGLCWSSIIVETIITLQVDHMDRARMVRLGMLMLCICFAIGSQIETYKLVEQGLQYEFIRKLAYLDGLTGIGNRTAYLERLKEYEDNPNETMRLGIVYLDVNNLKMVNDNQGHDLGDELIRGAAGIINNSFGRFGKVYRIGGDEFCVLMSGDNLEEEYVKGLMSFQRFINRANKSEEHRYDIQIAHGFDICKEMTKEKIEETIAFADCEMYRDKIALKSMMR